MLTDIQKSNIKSFIESFDLSVKSIRQDQQNHYKIFCEYDSTKVLLSVQKNRENDKYNIYLNISANLFVPKFQDILNNHKGYQSMEVLTKLINYSFFSMKNYISSLVLAESDFTRKEKYFPILKVMTLFNFSTNNSVNAGTVIFSKNKTVFEDDFGRSMYTKPKARPVDHIDYDIEFNNKHDNMKMIQDVLFSNYIKYMNYVKPFKFDHDDINEIIKMNHVDAAYSINANFTIDQMVAI